MRVCARALVCVCVSVFSALVLLLVLMPLPLRLLLCSTVTQPIVSPPSGCKSCQSDWKWLSWHVGKAFHCQSVITDMHIKTHSHTKLHAMITISRKRQGPVPRATLWSRMDFTSLLRFLSLFLLCFSSLF